MTTQQENADFFKNFKDSVYRLKDFNDNFATISSNKQKFNTFIMDKLN